MAEKIRVKFGHGLDQVTVELNEGEAMQLFHQLHRFLFAPKGQPVSETAQAAMAVSASIKR